MNKVRWGIMGTARIALQKVIPAMQSGEYCAVEAIASRSPEKAQEAADRLGIAKAFGTYEDLLADREIEAVYIPLPNHLHVPWSMRAIEAGKHVLCEKPIGMNREESVRLLEAAGKKPGLKVMEAFMYRFHPQWRKTMELVNGGAIGPVHAIQSFFSYYNVDPSNIRNAAEIGGGALMDIGCYCLSLSRHIFNGEPDRVLGVRQIDERFGTDFLTSGMLEFGGRISSFVCSTRLSPFQRVNILGEKGRIEIEIPFNAPPDAPCRLWLTGGDRMDELTFNPCDQYTLQADEFSLAVLNGTEVPTPLADAAGNMAIIDKLVRSSEAGCWVE